MPKLSQQKWEITPERMNLLKLQIKHCREKDLQVSMPMSGYCHRCGYDLVEHFGDYLEKHFVQGCPKCGTRYSGIWEDHSSSI